MKLTNPETIQESEKDFIDTINAELDWEAIEKMLLEKHSFTLQEEIEYKDGDLIVYNEDIAYKFDFEIKVPLSVIFNRQGECLDISTIRDDFEDTDEALLDLEDDPIPDPDEDNPIQDSRPEAMEETGLADTGEADTAPDEKIAQMASDIADMIEEINQGDG